jgi:hypothetical protein
VRRLVDVSDPGGALAPYEEFSGRTAPVLESSRSAVVDAVVAVVTAEGPVIGRRLHQSYVRAAGGQRVGKQIGRALNSAISTAVRRGLLVEEDPLGEQGIRPRTYRLPDQPPVRLRKLGPRTLDQVPPAELGKLMSVAARSVGWHNREQLFRATLGLLGLRRLTAQAHDRLQQILVVAEQDH